MMRAFKCALSLCVFLASSIRDFLRDLFGEKRRHSCVVLYYHSVPGSRRERFAKQLDMLVRHAQPISLDDKLTLQAGVRYAAVTFDDGFENFVDVALPELTKRRIPATVFVIADAVGKAFGPEGNPEPVMSLEQIRDLPADLVTIGSHTLTHPFLPSLSEQDSRSEITQSRAKIEQMLNSKVLLFSFPFGGFNEQLAVLCREAGYRHAFTTLPGFAFESPDQFVVGRVRVDPDDWALEFRLKLAGAYRWLPSAFRLKRRIVAMLGRRSFIGKKIATGQRTGESVIHETIVN
jgi:peptidoglycan/xylan/chitin deacetylase (PgdA/CDA1 family)